MFVTCLARGVTRTAATTTRTVFSNRCSTSWCIQNSKPNVKPAYYKKNDFESEMVKTRSERRGDRFILCFDKVNQKYNMAVKLSIEEEKTNVCTADVRCSTAAAFVSYE